MDKSLEDLLKVSAEKANRAKADGSNAGRNLTILREFEEVAGLYHESVLQNLADFEKSWQGDKKLLDSGPCIAFLRHYAEGLEQIDKILKLRALEILARKYLGD